jgi:site-specific DNA recombinase
MRAVIYARFSPRPDSEQCPSVRKQYDRMENWCRGRDWEVVGKYDDSGASGRAMADRPGVLGAIRQTCHEKATLVVWNLSRLARNTAEALETAEKIRKAGAHLASVQESIDTSGPMGRFVFTLLAALAQLQREQISTATSAAMRKYQKDGIIMGSSPPWGKRRSEEDPTRMVDDPYEQKLTALIVKAYHSGMHAAAIARYLVKNQFVNRAGNIRWTSHFIAKILRRQGIDYVAPLPDWHVSKVGKLDDRFPGDHPEKTRRRQMRLAKNRKGRRSGRL